MTKLRFTMDIIFDDTPTNRTRLRNLWNNLKTDRTRFRKLIHSGGNQEEVSSISIHLCGHDKNPPSPCVEIRKIVMSTIEREELF